MPCIDIVKTCQKGVSQQFYVLFIPSYNPYYKLSQKAKAEKQICTQTRHIIDFASQQINFWYFFFSDSFAADPVMKLADPVWCPL
jgi:hypothetical protein